MAEEKTKRIYLGELLVRDRLITSENLEKALEMQKKRGGLIGMILVKMGLITEENLMKYIRRQEEENRKLGIVEEKPRKKRLGEMLTEDGVITESQLQEALDYQKETGAKLGIALIDKGFIEKSELVRYLTKQSQMVIDSVGISTVEAKHMVSEAERS